MLNSDVHSPIFITNYDIIQQGWWDENEQIPGWNIIEISNHKITL